MQMTRLFSSLDAASGTARGVDEGECARVRGPALGVRCPDLMGL